MSVVPPPLGLHLHLIAVGPSLRFAIWFETQAPSNAPHRVRYSIRDVPINHPYALPDRHPSLPPWVTPDFMSADLLVNLPRIASYLPVPLPGLAPAWAFEGLSGPARKTAVSPVRVPGYVVPVGLSLEPLRALLHAWVEQVGRGLLSPHADVVMEALSWLHQRLLEGPLLPTLCLHPKRKGSLSDEFLPPQHPSLGPGWSPPMRLPELIALRDRLAAAPHLAASLDYDYDRRFEPVLQTWSANTLPQRLAVFLSEVFTAAAVASGSVPEGIQLTALESALREGALNELHAAHGNCLFAHHGLHNQSGPPKSHLHGRMHPLNDGGWRIELGLQSTADGFLPVDVLTSGEFLHAPALDHDDTTWSMPASVVDRDWRSASRRVPLLCLPELLTGEMVLTAAEGEAVLAQGPVAGEGYEYSEWLDVISVRARTKGFTAFTAAPASTGSARVRVRWELDPAHGETLHGARFVPSVDLIVDEMILDPSEVEALLASSTEAFVRIHDRVLGRAALGAALAILRAREKVLAKLDAGKGLSLSHVVDLDDAWAAERAAAVTESLFSERWQRFLAQLQDGAGVALLDAPRGFVGALRPYQRRGLSWMHFLCARGFGGCLADDMGLGKTVQVLALLATRRAESPKAPPDLVVCPTAVVLNWAREARRFTPGLRVVVHQGADRAGGEAQLKTLLANADVVITSYALLRRDSALLEPRSWSLVVIDEAQNLKNPEAQQTRVAKSLNAQAKLCLTGTPVENQLRDLWSVFDLAIPGLLGGQARFAKTFVAPLRTEPARTLKRLSARVGPFLLRRTKKDPAIAGDLPPKQEQEAWCDLTKEQETLYQAMTEATLEGIVGKDGVARRAHILAALTRFKQICNHPESFHAEHPDRLLGRSGKLDRTLELIEELIAEEQRVLVFTQFTEMGEILRRALAASLDVEADFYHGGLTPKAREAIVATFNASDGPPVLIVSLKAGGTGLNLTAASAVIHYDRWWNPAVEDQATDRAHRIGQTRSVNVYKLATRGTLEERVVDILESKRALASQALGGADASFITEMSDKELRAFLALDRATEDR